MNSAHKYIFSICLTFLLCISLYFGLLYSQLRVPTYLSVGIERLYINKSDYANRLSQPKLVVIAGSNTFYGIRCQTLQQEISLDCLNGSVHMGLGIDYLLHRSRTWLNPGDTVLLPLEYQHYKNDGSFSDVLIDYVLAFDPDYLNSLDWIAKLKFVMAIPVSRLVEGMINFLTQEDFRDAYQYDKSFLEGENGDNDQVFEVEQPQNFKQLVKKAQPLKLKNLHTKTHGMQSITAFIKWCKEREISVLATWPNTIWFNTYTSPEADKFFKAITQFYQDLSIPVLGKPQDFMYDKSLFFDNSYHLNRKGIELRTQQTVALLRQTQKSYLSLNY